MRPLFLLLAVCSAVSALAGDPWTNVFVQGEGYREFRIPAIARLAKGGALLAFAEGRNGGGDFARQDIVMKRSTDAGRTWSALQVIAEDGSNHLMTPCPLVSPATGRVTLFFVRDAAALNMDGLKQGKVPAGYDSPLANRVFTLHSDDGGVSWSGRTEITRTARPPEAERVLCVAGAGIALTRGPHRGRLLVPFHSQRGWPDYLDAAGQPQPERLAFESYVIFSDDDGKTWLRGEPAPEQAGQKPAASEPQLVELADGSTMMNCRNQQVGESHRKVAHSHDGGRTWSALQMDRTLVEPRCQAFVQRALWPQAGKPGRLLFSNPANTVGRSRGTLRWSWDDGRTWPGELPLYRGTFAHSLLVMLDEKSVGVLAELDGYKRIAFTSVALPSD